MFSEPDQVIKSKKLSIHWMDKRLNRHKYIFYILLKLKKLVNKNNKFYLNL